MRMLAVGLLYPPHYLGGYELVCEGVMRAARARGHDIRVIVSDYRATGNAGTTATGVGAPTSTGEGDPTATGEADLAVSEGIVVERSLRSYFDDTAQRAAALTPRQRLALERANAAVLERNLRDFEPQVISWWGMGGMSLSLIERVRRRGLPAVLVVHDPWPSYGPQGDGWTRMARRLRPLAPLLEPLCGVPLRYDLASAGRFVFNSEHTRAVAEASGLRPRDNVVVTPGVHARFLSPAPEKPWEWRLLQVGRIDPDKGLDVAIGALARLPAQATLTIVGAGDPAYLAQLHDHAVSLGVDRRVSYHGPVPAERLPELYAQADVVVFPIRWQEPWGLVPLEAMGVGRPVIATPRGGARAYLRDAHNALLIPPEDPSALAAAARRLAGDPRLRAELRSAGIATAAQHSAELHDRRLVDELERATVRQGNKLRG